MQKILVTGGTGFIGAPVIAELLERDYEVHAITYSSSLPDRDGLVLHALDLMREESVTAFFRQHHFDTLCHLAWYTGPKCHSANSNIDWTISSLHLLKSFTQSGGRCFLGAGSVSEYDFSYGYLQEEQTPLNSQSLYGQCKAGLYRMMDVYCKQNNVDFKWARVFNLYGPNEKTTRLMPSVINSILNGEAVRVSNCLKFQDYLHVLDTARGIVDVLESEMQGAVNICSGEPVQLRTIVESIARLMNYSGDILWGAIPSSFEDPLVVGSNAKLTGETGWKQQIGLQEGLALTINWWRENNV